MCNLKFSFPLKETVGFFFPKESLLVEAHPLHCLKLEL